MKVLVTGASGFICGYLIQELLDNGYEVVGLDNFSKYGQAAEVLRFPPTLPAGRGKRKRCSIDEGTSLRLRPFRRGGRHDRRHLLLSRVCLRPVGRKRTHHRLLLRCRHLGPKGAQAQKDRRAFFEHGLREHNRIPHAGRGGAAQPAATFDLWLSKARSRVFRSGRLRTVQASLHHCPAVQLRRHRGESAPCRTATS